MKYKFSKKRSVFILEMKVEDHINSKVTQFKYLGSVIQVNEEIEGGVNY